MHIHFAYYKFLVASPLPCVNKHGGREVSMPGHSDFPDGHKERELEKLRDAPLSDMDLMKKHILAHPSCQVWATIDRLKMRTMFRAKKQRGNQKHVAYSELEKFGLLREASVEAPVIELSSAARAARQQLRGRPRVIAHQKRARAEFDDCCFLELKRLRSDVDNFQR